MQINEQTKNKNGFQLLFKKRNVSLQIFSSKYVIDNKLLNPYNLISSRTFIFFFFRRIIILHSLIEKISEKRTNSFILQIFLSEIVNEEFRK